MTIIRAITNFIGANSAVNPKRLVDGVGVYAANLDNRWGDMRGLPLPSTVHTLTGVVGQQESIYRFGRESPSDTQYWFAFAFDIDVARSMLASDPTERTYGTAVGPFDQPYYTDNTFLAGGPPYPTGGWELGVPAPVDGMVAAVTTPVGGEQEDRVYVATFVRGNAEKDESAPSSPVTITCKSEDVVTLSSLPAVTAGAHNVQYRRIYVSTGKDFQQVGSDIAHSSVSMVDNLTRGAVLQTGGSTQKPAWLEPPDDLAGLIELWGGMHGAHTGKAYRTCVPYFPHAWPIEYQRIVPDTIVGTAKWGQNWLLATTGLPRVAMGTNPLAMVDTPIYFRQACVSKRSVKGVGHGVCWASNAGLCYYGQHGPRILTESILTRQQWRALHPETIVGASWGPWYFGFYNDGSRKGFMINTINPTSMVWLPDIAIWATFEDIISDALFLLGASNVIYKWENDNPDLSTAVFKDKVVRHPEPTCPGAARIVATTYPALFSLWADDDLKVDELEVLDDEPFRLPSGYLAEEFQMQISGTGPIEAVFLAEEIADLL